MAQVHTRDTRGHGAYHVAHGPAQVVLHFVDGAGKGVFSFCHFRKGGVQLCHFAFPAVDDGLQILRTLRAAVGQLFHDPFIHAPFHDGAQVLCVVFQVGRLGLQICNHLIHGGVHLHGHILEKPDLPADTLVCLGIRLRIGPG